MKNNAKHTPGPWVIHGNFTEIHPHDDPDGDRVIADIDPDCEMDSREANAYLIAAAPELLEALQGLASTTRTFRNVPKAEQEWTAMDDEALTAAFAAIAKARGK